MDSKISILLETLEREVHQLGDWALNRKELYRVLNRHRLLSGVCLRIGIAPITLFKFLRSQYMREAWESGITIQAIALEHKVTEAEVMQVISRPSISLTGRRKEHPQAIEIRAERQLGATASQLAKKYGMTISGMCQLLKRGGQ